MWKSIALAQKFKNGEDSIKKNIKPSKINHISYKKNK